jgi:hypothetical protein
VSLNLDAELLTCRHDVVPGAPGHNQFGSLGGVVDLHIEGGRVEFPEIPQKSSNKRAAATAVTGQHERRALCLTVCPDQVEVSLRRALPQTGCAACSENTPYGL